MPSIWAVTWHDPGSRLRGGRADGPPGRRGGIRGSWPPTRLEGLRKAWGSGPPNCLVVPNFSIGAVLMMRFAELAAPHFAASEIVELHHDRKVDAPSGTALSTAARMRAAGGRQERNVESTETVPGVRGGGG